MKLPALSKTYNGKTVLSVPELELEEGLIYAVIGANGCGKSTLARIIAGVEMPDDKSTMPQLKTGYMPQKSYPFNMTVLRNLLLGGGSREAALEMLKRFGLSELSGHNAAKLSGGETARMAMARILMQRYELLVLDEPTAAMDVTAALDAERVLAEYHSETNCTVLLVTHSLKQARRLADRVIFLKDGTLAEQGDAERVLYSPENDDTRKFLDFYSL